MSDPVVTLYRLAARLALGTRLTPERLAEMTEVFAALWREVRGRPSARARLLGREVAGLWQTRGRLRRRGLRGAERNDWNGRDRMGELWRDVRVGTRVLLRSPVVSMAAILTLGLGIGGTTAVFTVADGVILHPMRFPEAERLVRLFEAREDGSLDLTSNDNFRDLQSRTTTLQSMGAFRGISVSVTGLGEPERIRGEFVSASYFDVLGVGPALGRTIRPGEDVEGGERTAVLSHGYWVRRFAADPDVLGRSVSFNNQPHTIVGVMPADFRSYWDGTSAWISMQSRPGRLEGRGNRGYFALGRLADGVDIETARRELDQLMGGLAAAYPEVNEGRSIDIAPLTTMFVGGQQRTLVWSLLGAIGMVLLIVTANVANLQLARAGLRSREMAIRAALGGGRRRLLSQLLVENLTLALLGGGVGIGVAVVSLRLLLTASYSPFSNFDISLSRGALGAAGLLTIGVGVLAGLLPALRGSTTAPAGRLREDGRSGSDGPTASRFRSGLIVAQMAMAVMLLIGAGLMIRTTAAIRAIDVGFDAENVLTGETRLTAETYADVDNRRSYLEQVVTSLQAMPGTSGATLILGMPFSGDGSSMPMRSEGSELEWEEAPVAFVPAVAEGYFDFMRIPLIAGRTFDRTDDAASELVVVASRTLARRMYPDLDPIGRMLETPEGSARIIGVVEDTRRTLAEEIEPTAYLHMLQFPPSLFSVLVRTQGPPEGYERALREAFWSVDSNQPLWEVISLEDRMDLYSTNERFLSTLLAGFAGLALVLAAVGMYGVMAHGVGRRRHELGVRIALGAGRGRVLKMVLRQGVALTLIGAALGVASAAAGARLLGSVLYGVDAYDPVSFVIAPAVLIAVAALATYLPARRATRVDPMDAFRA